MTVFLPACLPAACLSTCLSTLHCPGLLSQDFGEQERSQRRDTIRWKNWGKGKGRVDTIDTLDIAGWTLSVHCRDREKDRAGFSSLREQCSAVQCSAVQEGARSSPVNPIWSIEKAAKIVSTNANCRSMVPGE